MLTLPQTDTQSIIDLKSPIFLCCLLLSKKYLAIGLR